MYSHDVLYGGLLTAHEWPVLLLPSSGGGLEEGIYICICFGLRTHISCAFEEQTLDVILGCVDIIVGCKNSSCETNG